MGLRKPAVRIFRILLFGFLSLLIFSAAGLAEKVRYVIDGDTVIMENDVHVRLLGINAPEIDHPKYGRIGEPFGKESADYLRSLLEGHEVRLENGAEPKDRFGRTLAYLYRDDGLFINRDLVEKGYAETFRKFDFRFKAEFLELEKKARQAKIGMWAGRPDDWKEQFLHWLTERAPHRKTAAVSTGK